VPACVLTPRTAVLVARDGRHYPRQFNPTYAPGRSHLRLNPTYARASSTFNDNDAGTQIEPCVRHTSSRHSKHPRNRWRLAVSFLLGISRHSIWPQRSMSRLLDQVYRGLSGVSVTRLENPSGYSTPTFTSKSVQRQAVESFIALKGFVPAEVVPFDVTWFYDQLGIDDTYFANESADEICDHIIALYGAKVVAYTKKDMQQLDIDLEKIQKPVNPGDRDGALFIHTSPPGITVTEGPRATCERKVRTWFLRRASSVRTLF